MNKQLARSIGSAAREARKALQLTQEDAAERIDVSVEFYARIERGTSLPSILTFARIMSALGVSADAMLGRQPAVVQTVSSWTPAPPEDSPEIRRLVRRLRKAEPGTLRLINLLLKEMEAQPHEAQDSDQALSDGEQALADSAQDSEADVDSQAGDRLLAMALPREPLFHGVHSMAGERPVAVAAPIVIAAAD